MSTSDMSIDFSEHSGKYLGVGFHNVFVYGSEIIDEAPGKKPHIIITFQNENEQTHRGYFYLTKEAMWRFVGFCVTCGLNPNSNLTVREIASKLLNRWVTIELHIENYQGKDTIKLKNVHKCKSHGENQDDFTKDEPGLPYADQPMPPPDEYKKDRNDPF